MLRPDDALLKYYFKKLFAADGRERVICRAPSSDYEGKIISKALKMKSLLYPIYNENEEKMHFEIREHLQKKLRGVVKSIAEHNWNEELFPMNENYYMEKFSCTVKQFKKRFEKLFKDGMAWQNHGRWHIDHIKPHILFDLNDPEQQKKCFSLENLQPLWANENKEKHNVLIINDDNELEALYGYLSELCGEL